MDKTILYGASDDLIEVDGAISEEFNPVYGAKVSFKFSDETKGTIQYGDGGQWQIILKNKGKLFDGLYPAVGDDKNHERDGIRICPGYSDVLIMHPGVEWVKVGKRVIKA